jgi:hypothetical protein
MNSVPLVVAVYRDDPVHPPELTEEDIGPLKIDAFRSVALAQPDFLEFAGKLGVANLRDATQSILRRLGDAAEPFLQRELDYHFLWMTLPEEPFGPVFLLFVVTEADFFAMGGCLCHPSLRSTAN